MKEQKQSAPIIFLKATRKDCIKGTIYLLLYFAFLIWVGSWLGLLVAPLIFDIYFTKYIKWGWWKELENPLYRFVMSWVDAIVFAGIAIYFLNNFFFQNFVIPTSSLEKTMLVGDYLCVSKLSYGPAIPRTPLTMPLTQNTMPAILGGGKSYLESPQWEYRRVKGFGNVELNDIVVFNFPAGDTVCVQFTNPDYRTACYSFGQQMFKDRNMEFVKRIEAGDKTILPQLDYLIPNERDREIVKLHYGLGVEKTPTNVIGEQLGITSWEVEHINTQAIAQLLQLDVTPTDSMTYEQQQLVYERQYNLGRQYILSNPQVFGEIVVRPTDRKDNYVKRCVGLPGQVLRIIDGVIHLDGKAQPQPEHAQFNYNVTFLKDIYEETLKDLNISQEDIQSYQAGHGLPLTQATKAELERLGIIGKNAPLAEPASEGLYPINMLKNWTAANYGGESGIWIPKKGEKRTLTLEELPIYAPCITQFEGNTLEVKNNQIFINGKATTEYTFQQDYYWMMGDNRDCSADSRFWGFVPEDHIVGKPLFVWLSLDPDRSIFDGGIRWNRLFKTKF